MSVNVPRSRMPGIAWPAIPDGRAATLLAIQFQLEQSQWWSPDDLAAWQLRQLRLLLAHAGRSVPFYRERWRKAGFDPRALPTLTWDDWRRLPILTRADIQDAGEQLYSTRVPPEHGKPSVLHTSGSTGRPIAAARTQLSILFWEAFTQRDHQWQGRDRNGKLAVIRHAEPGRDPYPEGTRTPNWGHARRAVYDTGPCVALNVNCSPEQQVDWLRREQPDYLLSFPTNVARLAEYCLEHGIRLSSLRQVQTISEVLRPEVRELCRRAWSVRVVDMYSSREAGYIALQCPAHEHLHVQSEGILVEILDENGAPCSAGQVGRVVVTPLHNFAMPLIRYEIGDHAELGPPCPCGRGLPVLTRIVGRTQNMVVLPDGSRRWTLLSSDDVAELRRIAPIRQYQFIQRSLETIDAMLASERPLSRDEEERLRAWLETKLGHAFAIRFIYVDEIPRAPSGKFHDFISQVAR